MERPKQMRNNLTILKDKVSILKATILLSSNNNPKPTTSLRLAILRATTLHHPTQPPPLDAVLSLTLHHHHHTGGALLHALLHRLHGSHSAYVALKCLLIIHYLITHGTTELKEHIEAYSCGPLFNLSNFVDESDHDTCQLSSWVRWYTDVLDYRVKLSRLKATFVEELVCYRKITSSNHLIYEFISFRHRSLFSLLVDMVEKICGAPKTLYYQKLSLVYEIMKLVGEDYRMIMREIKEKISNIIFIGIKRVIMIIEGSSDGMLETLLGDLNRVENCRENLLLMFLNKMRYDGVWELIEEVRILVEEVTMKKRV